MNISRHAVLCVSISKLCLAQCLLNESGVVYSTTGYVSAVFCLYKFEVRKRQKKHKTDVLGLKSGFST